MVVGITKQPVPGGVDPFDPSTARSTRPTTSRTGGCRRTSTAACASPTPACATRSACGPGRYKDRIVIRNFVYSQGDLSYPGKAGLPPAVRQGHSLTFVNEDSPLTERFHTITACSSPVQPHRRHRLPAGQRRRRSTPASSATARRSARGSTPAARGDACRSRRSSTRRPTRPSAPTVPGLIGDHRERLRGHAGLQDAEEPGARHLHVLLPDPPVHARCVPRREEVLR